MDYKLIHFIGSGNERKTISSYILQQGNYKIPQDVSTVIKWCYRREEGMANVKEERDIVVGLWVNDDTI